MIMIVVIIIIQMSMFVEAIAMVHPGSFDECRFSARWRH